MAVETINFRADPIGWCGMHHNYLNAGELEIIVALARSVAARTMTEIGCRDGRTARVVLDNVSTLERYVGLDVPPDYQPEIKGQLDEIVTDPGHYVNSDPRFKLLISKHGSLDFKILEPSDVIFIDGDHSKTVVAHDSRLAHASLRKGGVIIWHDYDSIHFDDVTEAVQELDWPVQHVAGTWLAFYRK
jgi:predicted O-methyltransferase YrrM